MKRKFLAGFFFWLILGGCQQTGWQEFSPPEGDFTARLPGAPTKVTHRLDSPIGPLDIHVFTLERPQTTFIVSYSDYPPQVLQHRTAEEVLAGAREGAVAKVQGRLVNENPISHNQLSGREVTIDIPDGRHQVRLRFFLVKNRLYQVGVATPKGRTQDPEVIRFLESFTVRQP
jgi:hypothetical protein|uniref:DUF1795 domain-containing protein n=1 Tax=Desulfobacca acetoxidans TaxID=60893 RepID=A0A7C5EN10_9BACT